MNMRAQVARCLKVEAERQGLSTEMPDFDGFASAAINALREPTEPMLHTHPHFISATTALTVWRSMINIAAKKDVN